MDGGSQQTSPVAGRATRIAPVVVLVLLATSVATTFAPWLRTGAARRTSHQVVRAADRLDVLAPGPQAAVSVAWAFLPLVACLAALALVLDRPRLGASLAAAVGLVEVALALVVTNAPRSADWGVTAGLAAGVALVIAAAVTTRTGRSTP